MRSSKTGFIVAFASLAAILLMTGGMDYLNTRTLREGAGWVTHTHEVLEALQSTMVALLDAETGQRGYLVTGDPRYLEPYQAGTARIERNLERLRSLTADAPDQQRRLEDLAAAITLKRAEMQSTIALQQRDPAAARRAVMNHLGRNLMDSLRGQVHAMAERERTLLAERERQSQHSYLAAIESEAVQLMLGLLALAGFMILLMRHLAERAGHERELEERSQWLQVTLRSVGDGLIASDGAGAVTFMNPVAEHLTGWSSEAAAGQPMERVFRIINEETGAPAPSPVARVLREGRVLGLANHTALVSRTGEATPIEDSAAPILTAPGVVAGVVLVFRDVTTQRRTATALRQAEAQQRKLEERMLQSEKLEALGVLVAGVSHNFNNLLAIIMGTASMHELTAAGPEVEAFRTIGLACQRGRTLVQSLTHFARPSLAPQEPIELTVLLAEASALLASTGHPRAEIRVLDSGEPLWLLGDAGSISSVLVNLGLNALDAMPTGGTLTFRAGAPEPGWVEVVIEDTGTGMGPEVLARATEPFFTTKEVGQGTGLGLSMSHGLIKAHGGTLEITSAPGHGTQVRLRLPRIHAPGPAEPGPRTGPHALDRVLLVDDDADVRLLMTRMLRKAGVAEVQAVAGGLEALAWLQAGAADLVILDQNMPGMDGIETLARIREGHPDLPVLISSGQPGIQDWPCFRQPGVAVISKPFTMTEIRSRLAEL